MPDASIFLHVSAIFVATAIKQVTMTQVGVEPHILPAFDPPAVVRIGGRVCAVEEGLEYLTLRVSSDPLHRYVERAVEELVEVTS